MPTTMLVDTFYAFDKNILHVTVYVLNTVGRLPRLQSMRKMRMTNIMMTRTRMKMIMMKYVVGARKC